VLTLVGTPAWANWRARAAVRTAAPARLPQLRDRRRRRYPWVRYWLIWNEPNKRLWLRPTKAGIYVRHLLNPGYEGIHAVLRHALVGGARRGPRPQRAASHPSPGSVAWPPRARSLTPTPTTRIPSTPSETPSSGGCKNCPWITMATIRKLLILVKRHFGSKPIWLTEYGYQTNPPDTFLGVTLKRQATNLSLAAMRAWRCPA
jgi:hypothetical protein